MREQIVRIILRVIAGILLGKGVSVDLVNILDDPAIAIGLDAVIGMGIWAATEIWFYFATPSKQARDVAKAVDSGQKVTVEGPRGGETVIQKEPKA